MNGPAAKGTFLIAAPSLYDPNFRQTVVLLCEHNDKGSMGLVINRPTELVLTEALRQLALPDRDDVIYRGGPVQPDHILILIRSDQSPSSSHHVFGAVYLGADVPTLQVLAARNTGDDAPPAPADTAFRGYAGYAGWGAGQLDAELATDSWITMPADSKWIFDADPRTVWPELMRALGPRYAFYADMPRDPNLN